jgi:hypothetical protein
LKKFSEWFEEKIKKEMTDSGQVAGFSQPLGMVRRIKKKKKHAKNM